MASASSSSRNDPLTLPLVVAAASFIVVTNAIAAILYPLAFQSTLDQALFGIAFSALELLVATALICLWARLPAPGLVVRLRILDLAVSFCLSAIVVYLLNSFLLHLGRGTLVVVDALILATGTLTLLPAVDGARRRVRLSGLSGRASLVTLGSLALLAGASFTLAPRVETPAAAASSPSGDATDSGGVLPPGTNVLLLVVDTLRNDHLGFSHYVRATTPNLDRWANESVVFEQAIAQATRTTPSMASLFTGLTPLSHRIIETRTVLDPGFETMAEVLAAHGYRTTALVANPAVAPGFGFDQGFDEAHLVDPNEARFLVDAAIERLEQPSTEPWFLWLHLIDPHSPYSAPAPHEHRFDDDDVHRTGPDENIDHLLPPRFHLDDARSRRDYVARYDAEIYYADEQIGRLLAWLRKAGKLDDTLIVFTSDHGEGLSEHGEVGHGTYVFDTTAHVPLVVSHPLLPHGRRVPEVVRSIDVLPTTLSLLGLQPPEGIEGRVLVSLLMGSAESGVDASAQPLPAAQVASNTAAYVTLGVREARWKLVYTPRTLREFDFLVQKKLSLWPGGSDNPYRRKSYSKALYSLDSEPPELLPVEAPPEVVERLTGAMLSWIDSARGTAKPGKLTVEDVAPDIEQQLRALGYVQ